VRIPHRPYTPFMHRRTVRGAISRKTALMLGMTCSVIAVGGILAFYFTTGTNPATNSPGGTGSPSGSSGGPPDVPIDVGPGGIGKTGRALNELIDQKNPTRIKAHIGWKQLDPLPKGQYSIVEPRAWIYLEDGRTLELRAATGTIRFTGDAKQRRPESGRFEGGVRVRVFAPGVMPASAVVADAGRDTDNTTTPPPVLLAFAATMNFDTMTNDYSTVDRVRISTEQTEAELTGLHIVYNDLLGRPDLIESTSGFIRFTKSAKTAPTQSSTAQPPDPATTPSPSTPNPSAIGENPATSPTSPAQPTHPPATAPLSQRKVDLYRADFAEAVELRSRGQSITSDKLLVWARLIDGKLSDAALGDSPLQSSTPTPPPPPGQVPQPSHASPSPVAAKPTTADKPPIPESMQDRLASLRAMPPGSPASITPVREDDVLLVWTGPLSVYTLDAAPPELDKDDVAARFIAEGAQPVKLSDRPAAGGAEGPYAECSTLDYAATTKNAVLKGLTPSSVHLADPKNRRDAVVDRFELNLATGIAHVPGGGTLSAGRDADSASPPVPLADSTTTPALADAPATHRTLTWTESADFQFDIGRTPSGEGGIRSLREASFTGSVEADDGRASITGDFLHAWFAPIGTRDSAFSRVVVEGSAVGTTWSARSRDEFKRLAADRFDVAFRPAPDGNDTDPNILTATGHVKGEQHEYKNTVNASPSASPPAPSASPILQSTSLTSDFLEASLLTTREKNKKRTDVGEAYAKGTVHFERSDGIHADSDELRARLDAKQADLTGSHVVIARGESSVSGTAMRLDGNENSLLVKSSGEIDHQQPATPAAPTPTHTTSKTIGHVHVSWSRSMSYNDTTGIGTCEGDAVVTQDQDALHHSTAHAEQVALYLEPAASRTPRSPQPGGTQPADVPDARLLRAVAIGSGDSPERRAKVESREYIGDSAAKDGRKLERLTYIEGIRIIADDEHGIFEVPSVGRALVLDHRAPEAVRLSTPANPSSIPIIPSSNSKGTTLFAWGGWMKLNRATSIVELQDGVELTHKPLDDAQQPIKLTATHVEGHLKPKDPLAASLPGLSGLDREQLVSATATGNVLVQTLSEDMRLSAGQIEYDVETQVLTASSPPGESAGVEYIDLRRATPVIGKKLIVILKPDGKHEVAIIEPMPVTAPLK